ncbi:MAG: AMP-binding protein [Alphaproteobacteria bacterium]
MTDGRSAAARRPFPWEASYPPGVVWDAPITTTTLPDLLRRSVARHAESPAIDYFERTITYGELGAAVRNAALALHAAGVGPGRTLALFLPNAPANPIALFGGLEAGARIAYLSPLDGLKTLAYKLKDCGAETLVTTDIAAMLDSALRLLDEGHVRRLIVVEDDEASPLPRGSIPERPDVSALSTLIGKADPTISLPRLAAEDVALLQYTGGTTGVPKAAVLTHVNLTATASMYENCFRPQEPFLPGERRVLCVLPLSHIYALTTILVRYLGAGDEILLRPRFDALATLDDIERKRVTSFPGVPTMWIALAAHPSIGARDLSSLFYCGSGGAPLPVEVARRFRALTGHRLRGGWGLTETSPGGTTLPMNGPDKPGSIGLPLPGIELQVVALDDPKTILPPGETGEIRIKGPNVTRGYWNNPEATAAAFVDGFFLTGDVGYMDEDGFFYLVDRKKDMIIVGGVNVYPQVIEQAIYEHPDVEEAIVIGIPDERLGEVPKAFVKLRDGSAPLSLEALRQFLDERLGPLERPVALDCRSALPRTAVGKLSHAALREERAAASSLQRQAKPSPASRSSKVS